MDNLNRDQSNGHPGERHTRIMIRPFHTLPVRKTAGVVGVSPAMLYRHLTPDGQRRAARSR